MCLQSGKNALMYALQFEHHDLVNAILASGTIDVNDRNVSQQLIVICFVNLYLLF